MPRFDNSVSSERLIQLKKKRKTMSEVVNEQVDRLHNRRDLSGLGSTLANGRENNNNMEGDDNDSNYYDEMDNMHGVVEEYDMDEIDNSTSLQKGSKRKRVSWNDNVDNNNNNNNKDVRSDRANNRRLRLRGPLDSTLSSGKYAATPVNVESTLNDIFGALEMNDMDDEGDLEWTGKADEEEEVDEDNTSYDESDNNDESTPIKKKMKNKTTRKEKKSTVKRKKVKDMNEEEYTAWLDAQQYKSKGKTNLITEELEEEESLANGSDDDEDDDGSRKNKWDAEHNKSISAVALNNFNYGEQSEESIILEQLARVRQSQLRLVSGEEDNKQHGEGSSTSNESTIEIEKAERVERTKECIRHFQHIFQQLLRIRLKLQPTVMKAVSLPQYYAYKLFTDQSMQKRLEREASINNNNKDNDDDDNDDRNTKNKLINVKQVKMKYEELQVELKSLLNEFLNFGSLLTTGTLNENKSKNESTKLSALYDEINDFHSVFIKQANDTLDYWGNKLLLTNRASNSSLSPSATITSIGQPLPQQIAAILSVKSRLRSKVNKNRSHVHIIGHPTHYLASLANYNNNKKNEQIKEAQAARAINIASGDVDSEVFDDSDFLHELVHRADRFHVKENLLQNNSETKPGNAANMLESMQLANANSTASLLSSNKLSRKGFHRLTKGKTINYDALPKLVGFCVADGFDNLTGERNEVIIKSLFQ